ncbi:uncharacterized protein K460DRAFT_368862 [Cucurbitaria berberidis CBS 394.84]|uniref:Mid2 domain-containing protein n=1 Tax=Cucurbitaria berberidis CBS 394.84 TaxID=1168544 RepID=A0A9P4GDN2_9PLEO|nr:uncharacterized protein K460DRAFT_368862 [Cucurbitaria berberidis CBS 394.84]KAF1843993.1 hypothetical protein K460DRAFT_368862 [Cucurbitaria berberidis CBS 394.84]
MSSSSARTKFRSALVAGSLLTLSYTPQCFAATDSRACYDSKNNIVSHQPCVAPGTKAVSHCCSTIDTCLGDTLCLSQFGTLYVGSCTIKDWSGGNQGRGDCPKYCSTQGLDIGLCNFTSQGWEFCCGALKGIDECCAGQRFTIQNTTNQYLQQRVWNNANGSESPSPSTSSAAAASSSSSSSLTSSSTNSSQCPAPASNSSMGALIGLGVGLGIPLLIALALLSWENRKRRHAEAQAQLTHHSAQYQVHEVGAGNVKSELASHEPVHELASEREGHEQRWRS